MCAVADPRAADEHSDSGARIWLVPRPGLFELLGAARRVVQVSAPAGSGKTFLLRSWIAAEGLSKRTAWVSVARQEHDPQVFWLSVLDSLRQTGAGSERVRELTAAPDLDGANVVGRLLEDLSSLREPLWLVIDDLHELQADEVSRNIELLLETAPPELRFVLLTRHDLRLGLHRLRVEGELTEIRAEDLRFTLEESRALLEAVGVRLSDGALESLVTTTEGWAAGLRLVALSLARHPDPERYAVSFSGRDRAVADYLLAEVLERQPAEVRQLLLRTSLLERVSGPLADRLTGGSGSYGILAGLEDAGAFVAAVDPERTWFRYHHLFRDLLALELQRTAPQEVPGAAYGRRRVVGRTRVSGRGDSPRAGGRELGLGGAAACRQLVRVVLRRTARHSRRASVWVSRRRGRSGSRAGGARRGRQAGGGVTGGDRAVSGLGGADAGVGDRRPSRALYDRACVRATSNSLGPATTFGPLPRRHSDCSPQPRPRNSASARRCAQEC